MVPAGPPVAVARTPFELKTYCGDVSRDILGGTCPVLCASSKMYSATRLISRCVVRKSSIRREISEGAPRVADCRAMYEAIRPRAKVRMPTTEAVVDRGLSPQLRIVGVGAEGEAIGRLNEPLSLLPGDGRWSLVVQN